MGSHPSHIFVRTCFQFLQPSSPPDTALRTCSPLYGGPSVLPYVYARMILRAPHNIYGMISYRFRKIIVYEPVTGFCLLDITSQILNVGVDLQDQRVAGLVFSLREDIV